MYALLPLLLSGCFLPPSLAVDSADAGLNSPPTILSVHSDQQELSELETLEFEVNTSSTLELTLLDTDLDDTLYAKVFLDYDAINPTPPRSNCTPAPGGTTAQRGSTCDLHGLCTTKDINSAGDPHHMAVLVFDRPVLDTGASPLYQAMPAGGLSTTRTFFLNCVKAQP